jgi:hypothetical protein
VITAPSGGQMMNASAPGGDGVRAAENDRDGVSTVMQANTPRTVLLSIFVFSRILCAFFSLLA